MDKNEIQLKLYMFIYLALLIASFITIFLPFQVLEDSGEILLGVETVCFYAFIGMFIMISSFIVYSLHIWTERRIFKLAGFATGLIGSIEATVFGVFGFYFAYRALRFYGMLLLGSIITGFLFIASIIIVNLILIKMGTIEEEKFDEEIVYIE